MGAFVYLFLIGLHAVCGDVRRQLIDPGFGMPLPGTTKVCDTICDEETHETGLCGSDGKYYHTKCEFNNAACTALKAGDTLNIDSYGPCITLNTTCDVALQSKCMYHIDTTTTNKGRATITNSFCGSDKKTYTSECEFRHAQCQHQQYMTTELTLDHAGPCAVDTSNQLMIDCNKYTTAGSNSQLAIETSPDTVPTITCSKDYHPVCAKFDNIFSVLSTPRTFGNECGVCQYMRSLHKISKDNMIAYALHEGVCHNSILG